MASKSVAAASPSAVYEFSTRGESPTRDGESPTDGVELQIADKIAGEIAKEIAKETVAQMPGQSGRLRTASTTTTDESFMTMAALMALISVRSGAGGPFGCVIVNNRGEVLAAAHNTVIRDGNPCNHAEVNAIRRACHASNSTNLSDCTLYTSAEPCPMCWGACRWARIYRTFVGVDAKTAAEYGWDDEFFYEQIAKAPEERALKMTCFDNKECEDFVLKTPVFCGSLGGQFGRRLANGDDAAPKITGCFEDILNERHGSAEATPGEVTPGALTDVSCLSRRASVAEETAIVLLEQQNTSVFMKEAIKEALRGMHMGANKEREIFGAVIVKEGSVVSKAYNSVLKDVDPSATAEMNAIRSACEILGTHDLTGCSLFTVVEPDVMTMSACMWARLKDISYGLSSSKIAELGYVENKMLNDLFSYRQPQATRNLMFDECVQAFKEHKKLACEMY